MNPRRREAPRARREAAARATVELSGAGRKPMLQVVTLKEIEAIFSVTDAMGIHRESLVIPLAPGVSGGRPPGSSRSRWTRRRRSTSGSATCRPESRPRSGREPALAVIPPGRRAREVTNGLPRQLGLLSLTAVIFFNVSGGPYGIEDTVSTFGPGLALLLLALTPLVWSLPVAVVMSELAS